MQIETLDDHLFQLKKQMEIASEKGFRGAQMSQRIEDDLKRIMNSGWLNLAEYIGDVDKQEAS